MGAIGIIGGSGLYQLEELQNVRDQKVSTPFGEPSDDFIVGEMQGQKLIFVPRHGRKHTRMPSEVNFRANIYALKVLGAQWCISVSAVGSLQQQLKPGEIVVPDQFIDRTNGRSDTFFGEGIVAHVSMADPFCPVLSKILLEACQQMQIKAHKGGTYLCMQGPQFSTRAESDLYRAWGGSIIGMTNLTEAKLAREAQIAYASLCLVTDYDCWKRDEEHVETAHVLEVMRRNTDNAKKIIKAAVSQIATAVPSEMVTSALKSALVTKLSDVPVSLKHKLGPILGTLV